MKPYYTVPFSFSQTAWEFLQTEFEPVVDDYQQNAPLPAALITIDTEQINRIKSSIVWTEVLEFSKKYKLSEPYPQIFIYKKLENPRKTYLGNPHIDTVGKTGTGDSVPIRFNILLNGDENTEMVWWQLDRNSPKLEYISFVRPNGETTKRLQAKGKTLNEQWDLLGEPDYRCSSLARKQEYASFVRTDILHALNWTGNAPRLIFSLRYTETWSVIHDRLGQ